MKFLKYFSILVVITASLFFLYLILPGPSSEERKIYIDKGSRADIAATLAQNNLIREKHVFWLGAQFFRFIGHMQSGEYLFPAYTSPLQIILKMQSGDVVRYNLVIPEGLYTSEIIKIVDTDPNLHGDITQEFSEGELFPSTYQYQYGYNKMYMLIQMKTAMAMTLRSGWDVRAEGLPFKDSYQALILASIVEKETEHDDERPKIAAVFINRIKKGMKLQADPTTIYAITQGKYALDRPLTKRDLQIESPYNTYHAYGLPPSPICNPGLKSIEAVLHPAKTDALYFVLNSDGKHSFANNYKTHHKNVRNYYKFVRQEK